MTRAVTVLFIVLGMVVVVSAGPDEPVKDTSALRLMLSEVQSATMATQQYCLLVFADHRFHAEKANRKMGRDRERKVYEGQLSENDWDALGRIVDSKEFRELRPPSESSLIMQDPHPYTISIAREKGFQNMEFLTKQSRKPYESQLRPLLKWWESLRGARMSESSTPADSRCSLDSSRAIFSY